MKKEREKWLKNKIYLSNDHKTNTKIIKTSTIV